MGDNERIKGLVLAILATSLWGINGTVTRYLLINNLDPVVLVQIRLTVSALLLFILLFILKINVKISRDDIISLLILGIFGLSLVQMTYFYTISLTNVATAVFLQYLSPVFVALYGVFFKAEEITGSKLTAIGMSLLGSFLIVTQNGEIQLPFMGLLSGLLSALSQSFYIIYGKKVLNRFSPITVLAYGWLFGAVFWWLLIPPNKALMHQVFTLRDVFGISYVIIFATVIPFLLYFESLKYLNSTTMSVVSLVEPVVAVIVAYLVLGEKLTPLSTLGAVLILFAIYKITRS
ncbi:DMT family transporter [Carboxydothermus hydrogenoformans]|uniref:Putative membrane protein n=1 Tax=Carboxydothermus hydrogenoformans (strain ATCC BAA-161 / DSM 6008 / Z-2901) TaxID=246194 RepID=Q3AEV7_CARHZ|nr:DMT family transporter [Carboxydothermus hydrogenoformans]ABB14367.1 putative membrane protein [Carboxydothermus hydrogenoformans Z-2901]